MMLKPFLLRAAAATAILTLAACATPVPQPASIAETAARTPQLSTLAGLLSQSGLAETLGGAGPYTVFAPNNEAFKAVPAATMAQLAANKDLLRSVLTYHVLAGKVNAAEVSSGPAKTVQGANVVLSKAGNFVTVDDAVVQTADVTATNGVVHIIDRVLMPPKK
jgi:uncharacterized surface protein with fasciclin (FAS1) repeats